VPSAMSTPTRSYTGASAVTPYRSVLLRGDHTRPVPPAEKLGRPVSPKLSAVILACLEEDAEKRPASARRLVAALAACDDVGTWTEDDARAFWQQHPPATTRTPAATRDASSLATLSVLMRSRA